MFQNDDIFEECDFNKDPEPAEVNEVPNPHWQGITVRDVDDLDPQGFSTVELNNIYASLCNDKHGEGLVLECPSMEELEYYNPGTEVVDEGYILEAITVDNFSRTEKRMAAVVRTFNKQLSDSEIKALPPIVGKPKKSGTFAYVIVQLPFSDGQSVNVVFHSPEGDKKKIGPNDAIIAFRWLLNKRDITQVVAPEDGAEVSLETIAKRITQLVVKNSAKFEKQQKSAQAEREELEKAREDVKAAEDRQRELMDSIAAGSKDTEAMDAQLSSVLSQVENQKTINAELEAKIVALRKQAKHEKETGSKDTEKGAGNARNGDDPFGQSYPEFTGKPDQAIEHLLRVKQGYVPGAFHKDGLGPIDLVWGNSSFGLLHIIERRNAQGLDGVGFVRKIPEIIKTGKVENDSNANSKLIVSENDKAVIKLVWHNEKRTWLLTAYPLYKSISGSDGTLSAKQTYGSGQSSSTTPGIDNEQGSGSNTPLSQTGDDGQNPPSNLGDENVGNEHPFVNVLNNLISGQYDDDLDKIDALLDEAASQAEAAGNFDQYESLFNQAADHLTELYKKKAGAM